MYALESVFYPKARYWDIMQQRIDARFIHADDYPEMAAYVGGDGSHVASEHISEFTRILMDVLRRPTVDQ